MTSIFIIGGLVLTISVGAFMAMVFTSNMKDGLVKVIISILIALIIGFGLAELFELDREGDTLRWNNGDCRTCGETLELFDVEHHRNSGETYYYKCENGHLVKTSNYFVK